MRADVGELGSRADVIKIEWPPHGDGCRGRDREFADSPLEEAVQSELVLARKIQGVLLPWAPKGEYG
jgi:hypothetical protein